MSTWDFFPCPTGILKKSHVNMEHLFLMYTHRCSYLQVCVSDQGIRKPFNSELIVWKPAAGQLKTVD
jgi:hypothetical protein